MKAKVNTRAASQRLLKEARLEVRIVKAARDWCKEPETVDAYEECRGTESASAPGSFLCLYEAVEEFEKFLAKKGATEMTPATAAEALKIWDDGQPIDTVALADEKGNVLINQPELWARVMDLIRKVLGIINPGDLQDTYYAQGFLPMCFRLGVVPPPTTAGPGEAKRYNAVTWMAFQLLKDGFAMVVSRTPSTRQRIVIKKA